MLPGKSCNYCIIFYLGNNRYIGQRKVLDYIPYPRRALWAIFEISLICIRVRRWFCYFP